MANYILGDVMKAEAFISVADEGGKYHLEPYFSANTMTESTINISTTAEEVRGGWGNQLLGKIFHDSNFTVNLTEALWSLDYLAAQIGRSVAKDGNGAKMNEAKGKISTANALTFDTALGANVEIVAMFGASNGFCNDTNTPVIWAKDCDGNVYTFTVGGNKGSYTYTIVGEHTFAADTPVCIMYPTKETDCEQLIVKAAYEPAEFSLFLYGKIFKGDGCQKSKSNKVGTFTIEIPRFQLDGTVDLAMNPSSAATTSLNGSALAYGCTCGGDPEYAKITVILDKQA